MLIVPLPLMGRIFTEPVIMKIYTAPLIALKKFFLMKSTGKKIASKRFFAVAPPASKKCLKASPKEIRSLQNTNLRYGVDGVLVILLFLALRQDFFNDELL